MVIIFAHPIMAYFGANVHALIHLTLRHQRAMVIEHYVSLSGTVLVYPVCESGGHVAMRSSCLECP
jgi:hypothetical protein